MLGCDGIDIVDGDGSFGMDCRYCIQLCSSGRHICLFKCLVHGAMKQVHLITELINNLIYNREDNEKQMIIGASGTS